MKVNVDVNESWEVDAWRPRLAYKASPTKVLSEKQKPLAPTAYFAKATKARERGPTEWGMLKIM